MKTIQFEQAKIAPSKIVCVGRNYVAHIEELANEMPEQMVLFFKANNAIGEQLLSFQQETIHYETELCFLYRDGRFVAAAVGLDLTKRATQSKLKSKGLPWERAKAFSQSALFSDFIAIEHANEDFSFQLLVDNQVQQHGNVELMLFKPEQILEEINAFSPLEDGDIVMTGTPKGVGEVLKGAQYQVRLFCGENLLVSKTWQAD